MDKRNLFKILLEQMQLKDADILSVLTDGEIEKVDVYAESNQIHFYLNFPKRLHPDVYELFMTQVKEAFKSIARTEVWWKHQTAESLDEAASLQYFQAVIRSIGRDIPFVHSLLKQSSLKSQANKIRMGLCSQYQVETFNTKYLDLVQQRLEQLELQDLELELFIDESLSEKEKELALQRQKEEDQANLMEALEIQEKLAQRKPQVTETTAKPLGKDIPPVSPTPLIDLPDNQYRQVIEGYVFARELIEFRSGGQLLVLKITDYTSSVAVKLMTNQRVSKETLTQYQKGDWLRLEGDMIVDNYTSELDFRPRSIRHINKASKEDLAPEGQKRVELHVHSNMSQMDATNSVSDFIERAAKWGHPAIAITDHAGVQAYPEAFNAAKQHGIKMLYGLEAYVVNDGEPIAYNPQHIHLTDATYVVFDVETTGLSAIYDSIIELAGVKMQNGEIIDTFEYFVNPGHSLSAFTTELTGITDSMVEDAPTADVALKVFMKFIEGTILVAHNASFDMSFIEKGCERYGITFNNNPVIDTLELSRLVNAQMRTHGLKVLARHYKVPLDNHHRAIYDSEATGHIFYHLLSQAQKDYQVIYHDDFNQHLHREDSYKQGFPYHVTMLAKNNQGLRAIFKLVSISNIDYFYRTPRIPRSVLNEYKEHLLIGTACSEGEIFTTIRQQGYEAAEKLIDFYDYVEIQPPSVYQSLIDDETISDGNDLKDIMTEMIRLADDYQKPVVATGNVHYLDEKDAIYREILYKSMKQNANRELHLPEVHFRTTDEMLKEFNFLGEEKAFEIVVTNTQAIADMIDDVEVIKSDLYTPKIKGADQQIRSMSYDTAHQMYGENLPEIVEKRMEKELDSIISNNFAVIYLISHKLVQKSNDDGYLVGSRGSVGSSLIATLTGITEVNPLVPHYYCKNCQYNEFFTEGEYKSGFDLPNKNCPKCGTLLKSDGHDIPFETFLGFHGDKVPDIDLNFSGEYQPQAHAYTKVLFGDDYVYRAGTISTIAEKTAFGYVKGYLEATNQQKPQAERERLAKGIEGVKRTTGQHPGGIIVIPDNMDVYDFTPIQYPADDSESDWKTTHFEYRSIEENVLKLDILGHDDPTVIRMLQDLSGMDPNDIPLNDPEVMTLFTSPEALGVSPEQIFSQTGTLGIPEFGTRFVREMLIESKPRTFSDLLQISGLSHGTDVWLGNAQDLIRNNVVTLGEVIGCRDDIMTTLIQYGLEDGLAFKIMEHVRKGRGIPDDWQAEMRQHDVPEWYIESCLKIKYMFPKAHAAAYIIMALRVAYFKVHHPLYYYAAYLSVRAQDFDIVAMSQGKETVKHLLREIEGKGFDASVKERNLQVVLEIVNEMQERGIEMQMISLDKSHASDFIIEGNSLIPPFRTIPGLGANAAEQIIKAREENDFLSVQDLQRRGKVSRTVCEFMRENGILDGLPLEDQLSLF